MSVNLTKLKIDFDSLVGATSKQLKEAYQFALTISDQPFNRWQLKCRARIYLLLQIPPGKRLWQGLIRGRAKAGKSYEYML